MPQHRWISKNHAEWKDRPKKEYIYMKFLNRWNLSIAWETKQSLPGIGGRDERESTAKAWMGTFCGDGNVGCDGYVGIYICQNSWNC